MPAFATPILKVTERCNYRCGFCRYAKHGRPGKVMPVDLAIKTIDGAVAYNMRNGLNTVHVVFHGGEPLLAGKDFYSAIVGHEKTLCERNPGLSIGHSIQTNGSLLDDGWIDFFRDNRFSVGVSLDGPGELNSHRLTDRPDDTSADRVLANIRRAAERGLQCAVLSVITNEHLGRHGNLYRFFVENEIHDVGLCYCYGESDGECVDAQGLGRFLTELFDDYYFGDYRLRIREFETLIGRLLGVRRRICAACRREMCGCYPTVFPDGRTYFCDDLIESDNVSIGNLNHGTLDGAFASNAWASAKAAALKGVEICSECSLVDACGGGCFRHDRAQGDARHSYFCEAYRQLIPHVKAVLTESGALEDSTLG